MHRRSIVVSLVAGLVAGPVLTALSVPVDAAVAGKARAHAVVGAAATYVPLGPSRLLDTRSGLGAAKRAVHSGETVTLQVAGRGPVPASGAGAVVLSVTATGGTVGGFVTVFPTGVTRPTASNVNYAKGQTVPNLTVVRLGTGGKVSLYNGSSGTVQLIADVSGFYRAGTAGAPGSYAAVTPARVVDTRTGLGGTHQAVPAQGELTFPVSGHAGVPATGVSAVMLNLTATQPGASGYLTTYPTGQARPTASTLNFTAGRTVPNLVATGLGQLGQITVFNGSSGSTQVFADVLGYFRDGTPDSPGAFVPLSPTRVLDTRTGIGAPKQPVGKDGIRLSLASSGLPFPNTGQVPSAVAMNITATGATASGYVRVESDSASNTSNLNFVKGQTVAGLVQERPDHAHQRGVAHRRVQRHPEPGGRRDRVLPAGGQLGLDRGDPVRPADRFAARRLLWLGLLLRRGGRLGVGHLPRPVGCLVPAGARRHLPVHGGVLLVVLVLCGR